MKDGQSLDFIRNRLVVENCEGERKLFWNLSKWELLNLKPKDILDIPDRLHQEFGKSSIRPRFPSCD